MKKIVATLVVGLALTTAAFAQPTINIVPPPGDAVCTGEEICMDIVVENFTDILATRFFIQWDSSVLDYNTAQAFNLPNMGPGNFIPVNGNSGRLLVDWMAMNGDCSNPGSVGETVADGMVIFQVCFTVIGDYGAATDIIIPATATPITPDIKRKGAGCTNIGIEDSEIDTALVSSCVRPFIIDISDEQGNEGDLVCVDFRVFGMDALTSFQFPVVWDSTKASFENVVIPQNLVNLSNGSIGDPINAVGVLPGSITVSWNAPVPQNGITLADSTLIFQLCLRLKDGSCNMAFPVAIADQQPGQAFFTPQASNDFQNGFNDIAVGQFAGEVTVGPCNPTGVQVSADCGPAVNVNDQICVPILAGSNFENVTDLAFLMEWNPNILAFTGTQNEGLPGGITFNAANTGNGILGMAWDSNPTDRNEDAVLFEVCFNVVGLGGNSPFQFINNDEDLAQVNNGVNIGINPTNCEVEVNQPDGVVIEITNDLEGRPGDTLCFDFSVNNFTNVESMQFSLAFEPNRIEYIIAGGLQNLTLPGATIANFNFLGVGGGQITFTNWMPPSPETLPDGERIFTLCFRIPDDATPGNCDLLQIVDDPFEAEVITTESNNENVGLQSNGGNYCILSPEGFYLEIGSIAGDIQDTVCIPVKVSEFADITSGSFTINWNPGSLALTEVNDQGAVPGLNIDSGGQPVGNVDFDFDIPAGLSLADSTVLFELCFELVGQPDSCYAVAVSDVPPATVATLNGTGSLLDSPGEVCINDRLFLVDTIIIPESCPGAGDGSARVVVEGGIGPYIYSWETQPPQFVDSVRFLSEGFVVVTILDQSRPPLKITDTLFIPALGADLIANAGPDKVSSCDPNAPCTFISPQATQGPDIMYTWTGDQGGVVCSNPNTRTLLGQGPGRFILEVRDLTTGCAVMDTVLLTAPVLPDAEAGDELTLTCTQEEVTLDASASSQGDSIVYTWLDPMNNIIAGPSGSALTAIAQDTGVYYLQVEITTSRCTAIDSVEVLGDTDLPTAVASPGTDTTFLGCNEMATLTGFSGDNNDNFTFAWVGPGGDTLTTDSVYMTDQIGAYTFQVLNEDNGCFNSDVTFVTTDSAVAAVEIIGAPLTDFTCNGLNVVLEGVVSNITPDAFTFEWAATNGAAIEPGTETSLTPEITSPGTVELIVTSDQTGCVSSASIEVGNNTAPPVIDVAEPDTLDCNTDSVMLDASASAQGGPLRYQWRNLDLNLPVNGALTATVALEGNYEFTILDTISGCSAADTIMVVRDTLPPDFTTGIPDDLTCLSTISEVRTNVNLPFGTYTIQWVPVDGGNIQSGANDTVTVFDAAGTYQLIVTDINSGCTGTIERTIESFQDFPDAIISNSFLEIDCITQLDTIDASASTQNDTVITVTYQWNAIQGTITSDSTRDFLPVETGGIFELVVTNVNSQCVSRDTAFVFENQVEPVADAGLPLTIACLNTEGMLDGSGSSQGDTILYFWTNTMGDTVGTEIMLPVTLPGIYTLQVLDTSNGCSDTDVSTVTADGVPAQIVFEAPTDTGVLDLDCSADTVAVTFSIANDDTIDINNLIFEWDGDILTTADPFTVQVYTSGIFTLTATDTTSGCAGVNELVVNDQRDLPALVLESSGDINCNQDMVLLNGDGSAAGDSIQYQWLNPDGIEISTTLDAMANVPGTYQFVVTNTNTDCVASDTIAVAVDIEPPAIIFETDDTTFQCRDESLLLSASPSGLPGNFDTIQWSTVMGGVATPIDGTLNASVNGPGIYQLTLVSSANGCDSTATISIAADTLAPTVNVAEPPFVGCPGQSVSLDASQSGSPSDFATISWSTLSGSSTPMPATGSLVVDIDDAGTYLVTLVSIDNGCEATQEVVVELDPAAPVAEATASSTIVSCGESVTLNGSASSQGAIYDYQWMVLSGGGTVTPDPVDDAIASVTVAGSYQLVVINMQTMCSDTSAVLELALDPSLVAASANQVEAACGTIATISANGGELPANTTGSWTSLSAATVSDTASPSTSVTGLLDGENILVWSLSQDGCPNYSSDTLRITPESAPGAVTDLLTLVRGENAATINVAANDQLQGVSDWTVSVVANPNLGRVTDDGNGDLQYTLNISLLSPATDEFTYEICNALCPELCSEGLVEVEIDRDTTGKFDVPNGITPNNDGLNDALIFDQLLLNPDEYPDNELIVFNRWGDIVFEAKPYNNDWRGLTTNGDELPDGTYYYVLRLNIGEGEILRGDVTVIKGTK